MSDHDVFVTNELLHDFSDEELDALAPMLEVATYSLGHVFAEEGRLGHAAFLILSGEVAVTQRRDNQVTELGRMGPGQLFGVVALVDGGRRSATCTALTETRVATLHRTAFDVLCRSGVPAARKFQLAVARQMARDVRRLNGVLLSLSFDADLEQVQAALQSVK